MKITDTGIILSARKFGEHGVIAKILLESHGVYHGVARYALSKRQRGTFVAGNRVSAEWSARLENQLGSFDAELSAPFAAYSMQDAAALAALQSACALLEASLMERDPAPVLYHALHALLEHLAHGDAWHMAYAEFEMQLLSHLGYGLDFTTCAATGALRDLIYVSPKSGRAVSRTAGEPYREKLFTLPAFLRHEAEESGLNTAPSLQDVLDALAISGYFLGSRAFGIHDKTMPAARERLMQQLTQTELIKAYG